MFGLLKNPVVILFAVLSLVGAFGAYTAFIYQKGIQSERMACNNQKQEAINANIKIKKEQDEAIRSDDAAYLNRMRRRTF